MSQEESKWETVDRLLVHEGRVVLFDHTVTLPNGSQTHYEVDESIPFAAATLLVSGDHVLVIRQYRYPIDRWIFDLPAGGAEDGEEPMDTARRELEEEAAIVPMSLVPLVFVLGLDGVDVGALYLGRRAEDTWLELMEVAPDSQGQGVGAAILSWVVEQSAKAGRGTMLQVHKVNARAKRLYEREGFAEVGETETHHLLRHP
ncbi:GNAT family N-acetyltransferase [Brevibacterium sp. CBA3109]|uniref:GNAT family N-acetyltransferase n=1 Tax=Brevibacterium koreense TaxID=3140787 RepID=A0AAU7UJN9_9MICO